MAQSSLPPSLAAHSMLGGASARAVALTRCAIELHLRAPEVDATVSECTKLALCGTHAVCARLQLR